MNKHIYLYRVTLTMKDAEKYYYIGIRSCKCEPEDDTKYLGSPYTHKDMWDLAETIKKDIIISLPHNKENHENLSAKEMLLIKEAHTRYGLYEDGDKCLNAGMFPNLFFTEEVRLRHARAHNRQEVRDKKSLSGIKYYEDPEARKKTSQSLILYYADQAARDRHSVIMRKQETRDKISAVMKDRWKDPEARKKMAARISAGLKEYYKNNPNNTKKHYKNITKTCVVCGKTMNIQNFVRHNHGENCKRG